YGGGTHSLGYEGPNEGVVLELDQPVYIEQIAAMEEVGAKLNDFQESRPDCRVLVVFGMEAATNWRISDPDKSYWTARGQVLYDASAYTKELFDKGYMCDFVPSSEIVNGDVQFDGNR